MIRKNQKKNLHPSEEWKALKMKIYDCAFFLVMSKITFLKELPSTTKTTEHEHIWKRIKLNLSTHNKKKATSSIQETEEKW